MATEDVKYIEQLRKAWIKKSLEFQKQALIRNRNKEMAGSEIYELRNKEIQLLDRFISEV